MDRKTKGLFAVGTWALALAVTAAAPFTPSGSHRMSVDPNGVANSGSHRGMIDPNGVANSGSHRASVDPDGRV